MKLDIKITQHVGKPEAFPFAGLYKLQLQDQTFTATGFGNTPQEVETRVIEALPKMRDALTKLIKDCEA
jgi:hypothetical protein